MLRAPITIKDIAKELNISASTAYRITLKHPRIFRMLFMP